MNEKKKTTDLMNSTNQETANEKLRKRMNRLFTAGVLSFVVYLAMEVYGVTHIPLKGAVSNIALGFSFGILIVGFLYTSGYLNTIKNYKRKLFSPKN